MKRSVRHQGRDDTSICLAVLYKDGLHCCIREAKHSQQHLDVRGFRWVDEAEITEKKSN